MYLLKVSDDTKVELNLIRDALGIRERRPVSYNDVIVELLRVYKRYSRMVKS